MLFDVSKQIIHTTNINPAFIHMFISTKSSNAYLLVLLLLICFLQISGLIANTGHSVIFTAGNDTVANYDGMQVPVNITGGPLSYRYRFHEIHIHYGLHDQFGSEHSVDGYTFPAEVSSRSNFLLYFNPSPSRLLTPTITILSHLL